DIKLYEARKLAIYMYEKVAGGSAEWPTSVEKTDRIAEAINTVISEQKIGPTPVSATSLSAKPYLYLPYLHKILLTFEDSQAGMMTEIGTEANFGWLHRMLNDNVK
ncbi:hypothetical protein DFQ30_004909, partial [Apophysomyces sp. BC1015]